jgi:hypothetical protein
MKKYLLFVFLVSSSIVLSQNKIAEKVHQLQIEQKRFVPVAVLDVNTNKDIDAEKVVTNATYATINLQKINEIVANKYDFIELEIPYENKDYKIQLYRVDPFAEDFRVDTDKSTNIAYQKGVYYRGIIKGNPNSVSAFNFFSGEFNGIFSSEELGNIVVGKLEKPNNQLDYIVYSDTNLKVLNNFDCHVKEDDKPKEISTLNREVNTNRCVTFYFEIDYNLFQSNGSNTSTTTNWMTSVFNNVQTLFNNDGVTTALKSIYIWTSQDMYEGVGTASSDYLQAFAENRPVFNGDVGMLIGIDPGGLGGVAFLNSICGSINYAYSDIDGISFSTVPSYSWTIQVVTHEFGHSLGSPHTHACVWNGNNTAIDNCGPYAIGQSGEGYSCMTTPPTIPSPSVKGTIMSYCHLTSSGISLANGFGPQPAALLVSTVNSKTCLSTNCVNTCINTAVNIQTTNVTDSSVTVTWEDIVPTVTHWQVSVAPFGVNGTWTTVTSPTFSASGLQPNTYYKVRVRPVCLGVAPTIREKVFATNGDYCSGLLFTDTGGITDEYTDMESFTRTFIPNLPNKVLKVTFDSFSLEENWDYMYVYNGPDDTYPELNGGDGFTGTNSPGEVTSTATDGSLTFKFVSDQAVTDAGWSATVTCLQSLGINTNDFIDFSYYPNPTKNNVTLKSNTTINEVIVYNIEGRRLFSQTINALEDNINISQFATGTYFFKAKFGDKEVNFKILKL